MAGCVGANMMTWCDDAHNDDDDDEDDHDQDDDDYDDYEHDEGDDDDDDDEDDDMILHILIHRIMQLLVMIHLIGDTHTHNQIKRDHTPTDSIQPSGTATQVTTSMRVALDTHANSHNNQQSMINNPEQWQAVWGKHLANAPTHQQQFKGAARRARYHTNRYRRYRCDN